MPHGASSTQTRTGEQARSADPAPLTSHPYVVAAVLRLAGAFRPRRVLDVGCGKGALLGQLSRRGCVTVGIDTSQERIALARRMHPNTRFEVMAADELTRDRLREPPFDLVIGTEVLEHVCEPETFASGCLAALRPGGRVILSTPYHGWLKNVLIATSGGFDRHVDPLDQEGHIKFWSRRTLETLLTNVGFVDIEFHGAGRGPLVWKSMVMTGDRPV